MKVSVTLDLPVTSGRYDEDNSKSEYVLVYGPHARNSCETDNTGEVVNGDRYDFESLEVFLVRTNDTDRELEKGHAQYMMALNEYGGGLVELVRLGAEFVAKHTVSIDLDDARISE